MRAAAGIFGIVCGCILVALVARYGYTTSDNQTEGMITAFLFAAITTGGLCGHAFAVRLWRHGRVVAALGIALIVTLSLLVSLSNSVSAIATRGDARTAERMKSVEAIKDDRATVTRLEKERAELGAVPMIDGDAVQAARDAVVAAEHTTASDCAKRNDRCRASEAEEKTRRAELNAVIEKKGKSDRARKIDEELATLRARLAHVPAVGAVNAQVAMISALFGIPDSSAQSALSFQYLAIALMVDLLVVASFICFEVLGEIETAQRQAAPAPQAQPAPPAPPAVGAPERFVAEVLRRKRGKRMSAATVFAKYQAWCTRLGVAALADEDFVDRFFNACQKAGFGHEDRNGEVMLTDVELAA